MSHLRRFSNEQILHLLPEIVTTVSREVHVHMQYTKHIILMYMAHTLRYTRRDSTWCNQSKEYLFCFSIQFFRSISMIPSSSSELLIHNIHRCDPKRDHFKMVLEDYNNPLVSYWIWYPVHQSRVC